MMTGAASGSSTWNSDWLGVMPTPRAAIFTAGIDAASPVIVLRNTGSIE